jgi:hypothetical protein
MTIFSKLLLPKVLDQSKWQTRRPEQDGDRYDALNSRVVRTSRNGRAMTLWQVGKKYAIQPGRAKKGLGHFEVVNIRSEDVRHISHDDAMAEGFASRLDFLAVWIGFYDKRVKLEKVDQGYWHLTITTPDVVKKIKGGTLRTSGVQVEVTDHPVIILNLIKEHRPDKLYQAWALTFRLVESETAQVAS